MEYHITQLPKSEMTLEVILLPEELTQYFFDAAALISREVEIGGFRKGKAPYEVVKSHVGEKIIQERGVGVAVEKTYREVLRKLTENGELDDRYPPIGRPEISVTKFVMGDGLEYKIKLAVLPRVSLPDYRAVARRIRQNKKEVRVTEEEIGKAIEWLRESRVSLVTVARTATKGDAVEIDFEVRHDGVKIAAGDSKNHPFTIGKSKFLPGFDEAIIGMKQGDKRSFLLSVPENWHEKSLAGKTVEVAVVMKLVQEREIPALTDEFAKYVGGFSSVVAMRTSVAEGMVQEKKEKEVQRVRGEIIEAITRDAKMEIPDVLVAAEQEKMVEEIKAGIGEMGMKWEDYLLHIKKTVDDLRKEFFGEAEKRVRIALTLREIAKEEHIEPTRGEVEARASQWLARYRSAEDVKKEFDPEALREYNKGMLRNEKVFEFLERD